MGRFHRKVPTRWNRLVWPLSLGLASLLVYGAWSGDVDTRNVGLEEPEPELLKPSPRVMPPPPEPLFVPTPVAAAVPPLPPSAPLPPVDSTAARDAAEFALLRRRAPLLVPVSGTAKVDAAKPQEEGAGVVQAMAPKPAPAMHADARFVFTALEPDDPSLDQKILQGKTISAVLETSIHTALPGQVRAMVDEDVYGESGRRVLIPKMSRLVGEYETARISAGQSRVMVIWQRAILPDGTSVRLASPGTDGLGRTGVTGEVDNHYLERFGAAFLVSMMGVAVEEAAVSSRVSQSAGGLIIVDRTRSEAVNGLQSTVESILKSQANIPPTIQVVQGSRMRVFVARDLDLSSLTSKPR